MCILIIEDEMKIASYLVKGLNESGYDAECSFRARRLGKIKDESIFFAYFRCDAARYRWLEHIKDIASVF